MKKDGCDKLPGRVEREYALCAVGQPGVARACLGEPLQLVAFVCRQT